MRRYFNLKAFNGKHFSYEKLLNKILSKSESPSYQEELFISICYKLRKETDETILEGFIVFLQKNYEGYKVLKRSLERYAVSSDESPLPWSKTIHKIIFSQEKLDPGLVNAILDNTYRGVYDGFFARELIPLVEREDVSNEVLTKAVKAAKNSYHAGWIIKHMRPVDFDYLTELYAALELGQLNTIRDFSGHTPENAHQAIVMRAAELEPELPVEWLQKMFHPLQGYDA